MDSTRLKLFGRTLAVLTLTLASFGAQAVPVTYRFTATDALTGPPVLSDALSGSIVSGTFVYDNEAPLVVTLPGGGNLYGSIRDLEGTVGSYSFSDPFGGTVVNDDGFTPAIPVPGDFPSDFLQISMLSPVFDLVGFGIGDYNLLNVRMFWIEDYVPVGTPDFLDSSEPPDMLPSLVGRLAFDFIRPGEAFSFGDTVFFDGLTVSPVTVPEPASLSLLALGLLAFVSMRSRRRKGV